MPNSTSERLARLQHRIMDEWVKRALKEVPAAHHQEDLALRNSLPEYLLQLVDALSTLIDRTEARKLSDKLQSTRVGKKHGHERAGSLNYTMDQLIFEYHILRRVICDVMEEEKVLSPVEMEVIVCSIEQAVNDAATQFSDTLRQIQEQLTNTLAHDFRTPLTVARMNFQLIQRHPGDIDQNLSKATKGITNLERLDRLIQDLLDGNKMKTGSGLSVEVNDGCDLNWIIQEVITDLSLTYPNKIQMKSCGQCLGRWSESALRRVVENLTTNAIKYGDSSKPITISLTQTDTEATFSVHNEGKPIKPEEISILFQQFRRLRGAEEKIGWGLGLTVVKGITDAHKGNIEVESKEGIGTTFKITIPKEAEL